MANTEVMTQRLLLKGVVAEAGIEKEVAAFQEQFHQIIRQAKGFGEDEYAAAVLALTLVGLELAEEA